MTRNYPISYKETSDVHNCSELKQVSFVFKKWEVITITCPCIFTLSSEKSSYANLVYFFPWIRTVGNIKKQVQIELTYI